MFRELDVGGSGNKSPSVGTKKARKPRKASGSKRAKKSAEGLSSGNDSIDVNSIIADIL